MKNKENSNEKTPTQNKYKVAPKVYFYRVIYLKISYTFFVIENINFIINYINLYIYILYTFIFYYYYT